MKGPVLCQSQFGGIGSTGLDGNLVGSGTATRRRNNHTTTAHGGQGLENRVVELGITGTLDQAEGPEASIVADGKTDLDGFVGKEAIRRTFPVAQEDAIKTLEIIILHRLGNGGVTKNRRSGYGNPNPLGRKGHLDRGQPGALNLPGR